MGVQRKEKLDEVNKIVWNKARHVGQGYSQQKCINFTETFALIIGLEVIPILLSIVAHSKMKPFLYDRFDRDMLPERTWKSSHALNKESEQEIC